MKLLDSLGAVDDELISEAMEYDLVCEGVSIRVERKPVRPWRYMAAAAACVAVLGGTFAALRHIAPPIAPDDSVQTESPADSSSEPYYTALSTGTENSGSPQSAPGSSVTTEVYDGVSINDVDENDVISGGFYCIVGVDMPPSEVKKTLGVDLPSEIGDYSAVFIEGLGTFAENGFDGSFTYQNMYNEIVINVRKWEHVRSWNAHLIPAGVKHCMINGAETLIIRQKGTDSFGEYTLLSASFYKDNETAVSLQAYNVPVDEFIAFLRRVIDEVMPREITSSETSVELTADSLKNIAENRLNVMVVLKGNSEEAIREYRMKYEEGYDPNRRPDSWSTTELSDAERQAFNEILKKYGDAYITEFLGNYGLQRDCLESAAESGIGFTGEFDKELVERFLKDERVVRVFLNDAPQQSERYSELLVTEDYLRSVPGDELEVFVFTNGDPVAALGAAAGTDYKRVEEYFDGYLSGIFADCGIDRAKLGYVGIYTGSFKGTLDKATVEKLLKDGRVASVYHLVRIVECY